MVAVGFQRVIGLCRIDGVGQAGNLHQRRARVGRFGGVGERLRGGFQRFEQLRAAHIDDGDLVREGQNLSQLRRAEFAFRNIGTQVAAVPERDNVIRIDVEMVDAVGSVVLVKSGIDVSGNGEPAQGVRPEVAEVGFAVADCAGSV